MNDWNQAYAPMHAAQAPAAAAMTWEDTPAAATAPAEAAAPQRQEAPAVMARPATEEIALTSRAVKKLVLKQELLTKGHIILDLGLDCTGSRELANKQTVAALSKSLLKIREKLADKIEGGLKVMVRVHEFGGMNKRRPTITTIPLAELPAYLRTLQYASGETKWNMVLDDIAFNHQKYPSSGVILAGDGMEDLDDRMAEYHRLESENRREYAEYRRNYIRDYGRSPPDRYKSVERPISTDKRNNVAQALDKCVSSTPFFFLSSYDPGTYSGVSGHHLDVFDHAASKSLARHKAGGFILQHKNREADFDALAEQLVRHATREIVMEESVTAHEAPPAAQPSTQVTERDTTPSRMIEVAPRPAYAQPGW